MCCRYYSDTDTVFECLDELGISRDQFSDNCPSGVITPGTDTVMITGDKDGLSARTATWGFRSDRNRLIINARSETASVKPLFKNAMRSKRCLLPASCFYEWDIDKNKVTFYAENRNTLYLAGLWNIDNDEVRFVVLTTEANDSMKRVHDRMPLMVDSVRIRQWLCDTAFAESYLSTQMPNLLAEKEYEQMSLF